MNGVTYTKRKFNIMNNTPKKPKKDKYLKLVYTTFTPKSISKTYGTDAEYKECIKQKLIIRKVLLEDNDSYYYKFKNKIERTAKHTVQVISLYS